MINRKSRDEIKRMRHAGHIVALVHKKMKEVVQENQKTMMRYKLEMLEEAIKSSWLRDLDKTKEMNEKVIKQLLYTVFWCFLFCVVVYRVYNLG